MGASWKITLCARSFNGTRTNIVFIFLNTKIIYINIFSRRLVKKNLIQKRSEHEKNMNNSYVI